VSQRLHMRIREIEYLTLESATHRLVRHLEGRLPPDYTGPTEITLQESRQELASRLSMKPETLSRILRHLSDEGAIVVTAAYKRARSRLSRCSEPLGLPRFSGGGRLECEE
jgi:CRP-like cAMP-binding protein